MDPELVTDRERARFVAVRRRVFQEMHDATSRKRLSVTLPFQAIVMAVLFARGAAPARIGLQLGTFVVLLGALAYADRASDRRMTPTLVVAFVAALAGLWNTGGLESPLLLTLVPFLVGWSLNPALLRKHHAWAPTFLGGFLVMAILAHTDLGASARAFAPAVVWTPGSYVALAFFSAATATIGLLKITSALNHGYERIAYELAERREELCDESAGRTQALEGIAARLAHEVKNPLAAIKGLSTHMARNADDEKVKERLTIVAAEAERLQEIVEGFLSFSRGLGELNVADARPYDIARELSLLLETRAADLGVTIEVRGSRELTLQADGKKLRQALLNLVLNAMQASSRGASVVLEVAKSCSDGAAVVRVMDRGAGMTPEILERIRKPYYTTKEGGSGLGIAVARGIIEQHGGSLRFESASGRGTSAVVVLPACAEHVAPLPNPCNYVVTKARELASRGESSSQGARGTRGAQDTSDGVIPVPALAQTAQKLPS